MGGARFVYKIDNMRSDYNTTTLFFTCVFYSVSRCIVFFFPVDTCTGSRTVYQYLLPVCFLFILFHGFALQ